MKRLLFPLFFLAAMLAFGLLATVGCNKSSTSPTAPHNFIYFLQGTAQVRGTARPAPGLLIAATDADTNQSMTGQTDSRGYTAEARWYTEPKSVRVDWSNGPGTGVTYVAGENNNVRVACSQHPESAKADVQLCRYLIEVDLGGGIGAAGK